MSTLASTINILLEDVDFSTYKVKRLIAEGEIDAEHALLRDKG
jgi:hypothetical protein